MTKEKKVVADPAEQIRDHDYDPKVNLSLPKVSETMNKQEIVGAILSKDTSKLAEAKNAIKALLDARAAQFRLDSSKFVAKSLFEASEQK
jgi:hypothetical protein